MPKVSHAKMNTFTFRIEPALKDAFVKLADKQEKPAGEILRQFIRELVEAKRQSDFAREARRQSKIIALVASNSDSDEAEVLRQLDKAFDELSMHKDWKDSGARSGGSEGNDERSCRSGSNGTP